MVLKLHGHPLSTCTQRVLTVLKETNTSYELVNVDFASGEHKSPAFVEKQPFGQVPYLVCVLPPIPPDRHANLAYIQDDDGFIVFESRAITRYIAAKANSPLLPSDPKKLALFETAASIESFNFDPYASGIAYQRVFLPYRGGKTDETRVAELTAALEGKLAAYDKILSKQKYLAGDELTLADLAHLPYGAMLVPQGIKFLEDEVKFPNVAR
jgi:glutathione S-transferase